MSSLSHARAESTLQQYNLHVWAREDDEGEGTQSRETKLNDIMMEPLGYERESQELVPLDNADTTGSFVMTRRWNCEQAYIQ